MNIVMGVTIAALLVWIFVADSKVVIKRNFKKEKEKLKAEIVRIKAFGRRSLDMIDTESLDDEEDEMCIEACRQVFSKQTGD